MSDQRRAHLKEIFFQACRLEGQARQEFLDRVCSDDQQTRQEVESLLRYHLPETLVGSGLSETGVIQTPLRSPRAAVNWEGRQLGRHTVRRVIDSGGMGTVLEAFDPAIQRRVAIKVLHPDIADDESIRMRFLAEARAAGRLSHPNIVTIHEVAEDEHLPYIVMEYADGGSAADRLTLHGGFPVGEATRIVMQACRGLAAAHAQGLVHRDIKPANLLMMADGSVKITDFGIAKALSSHSLNLTQTGQIIGTPNFMSPEQCEGRDVTPRSDIYSLGATYYSLLVGRRPFSEQESLVSIINAHCNASPPDPREVTSEIPPWCCDIISHAMAKRPDDRFATVDAMRSALAKKRAPAGRPWTRRPLVRTALVGAALALVVAAWLGSGGRQKAVVPAASGAGAPKVAAPIAERHAPILVGVLHSLSGTMAQSERGSVDACEFAIEEINAQGGLLGRRVESIVRDGSSSDAEFARQAERLIAEDGVSAIFGCCTSSSRKAVKQVVEQHNHLLVYSVNTEGVETSPNIVYVGGGPSQTFIPCVRWAYAFKEMRSFFLVGSDYIYPRVVNRMLADEIPRIGGVVVGERYLPLGEIDVSELVHAIREANPDGIINTISGDTQIAFLRALKRSGVKAPQIATGVGEEEVRSVGGAIAAGDYSVATYFQSLPTQRNREFVQKFHQRYGKTRAINAAMESSYAAVKLWAQAVEQSGETDPVTAGNAMLGQQLDAPSGPIRIDPRTRYAYRSYLIGRVQPDGEFEIVLRGPPQVAPNPYPGPRSQAQWHDVLEQLRGEWDGAWAAP